MNQQRTSRATVEGRAIADKRQRDHHEIERVDTAGFESPMNPIDFGTDPLARLAQMFLAGIDDGQPRFGQETPKRPLVRLEDELAKDARVQDPPFQPAEAEELQPAEDGGPRTGLTLLFPSERQPSPVT